VAGVSYPTSRAASIVQQQLQPAQQHQQQSTPTMKERVFTGTVTKLHDNFGFIDEDVFFQTRWCYIPLAYFHLLNKTSLLLLLKTSFCDTALLLLQYASVKIITINAD